MVSVPPLIICVYSLPIEYCIEYRMYSAHLLVCMCPLFTELFWPLNIHTWVPSYWLRQPNSGTVLNKDCFKTLLIFILLVLILFKKKNIWQNYFCEGSLCIFPIWMDHLNGTPTFWTQQFYVFPTNSYLTYNTNTRHKWNTITSHIFPIPITSCNVLFGPKNTPR